MTAKDSWGREHVTSGTCWRGYVCGRLPVKSDPVPAYYRQGGGR